MSLVLWLPPISFVNILNRWIFKIRYVIVQVYYFHISDVDSYYSIGGYIYNLRREWKWITDETWDYENFAEDQPEGGFKSCLMLHYPSMRWHDVYRYSGDQYYICE